MTRFLSLHRVIVSSLNGHVCLNALPQKARGHPSRPARKRAGEVDDGR